LSGRFSECPLRSRADTPFPHRAEPAKGFLLHGGPQHMANEGVARATHPARLRRLFVGFAGGSSFASANRPSQRPSFAGREPKASVTRLASCARGCREMSLGRPPRDFTRAEVPAHISSWHPLLQSIESLAEVRAGPSVSIQAPGLRERRSRSFHSSGGVRPQTSHHGLFTLWEGARHAVIETYHG
jgi:hypothetical protein